MKFLITLSSLSKSISLFPVLISQQSIPQPMSFPNIAGMTSPFGLTGAVKPTTATLPR